MHLWLDVESHKGVSFLLDAKPLVSHKQVFDWRTKMEYFTF